MSYCLEKKRRCCSVRKKTRHSSTIFNELLANESTQSLNCEGKWQELHDALAAAPIADSGLEQCVLGGRPLYRGDDHHVCMVRPDVVRHIVEQGAQLDESKVKAELWGLVEATLGLYGMAAKVGGAVVFVARR